MAFDAQELVDATTHLLDGLDRELDAALTAGAEAVAIEARASHPYTSRTGDLEASTQAQPATGTWSTGTLTAAVVADTDYAQHVEAGHFAFLEPARARTEGTLDALVEDALERASR